MHRIAAYLALVLLMAGAARPAMAEPFAVGIALGLSGPRAEFARDHRDGLLLWMDDANAQGGILGRAVELVVLDHGSDAKRAGAAYDELTSEGRTDWLLAPEDDDTVPAAQAAAARRGRVLLAGAATADTIWQGEKGRVLGVLTPAGRQMADFLAMLVLAGTDKLALAAPEGVYAEAAFKGALTWAERFGLHVVLSERPAADWDAVVGRSRRAGAQALVVCGYPEDARAVALAVHKQLWRPMAVMATMGPCFHDFGTRLGPAAEGMFTLSLWEYDPGLEAVADFEARFARRFGRRPTWPAASGYAAGQILAMAAKRADSTAPEALARAMAGLDAMTVAGRFSVEADGRQARQLPVVLQWQDGRRHVVWPPTLAEQTPSFGK